MVGSTTRAEGDPGSNPALGKQWSREHPDEVSAPPTLPDANLRYQEALDCAKRTKGGYDLPFCPRSFDRAVMVAQWYDLRLMTLATRVRTLPWASRLLEVPAATFTLPDANLRY